jgi:hypothetical protein
VTAGAASSINRARPPPPCPGGSPRLDGRRSGRRRERHEAVVPASPAQADALPGRGHERPERRPFGRLGARRHHHDEAVHPEGRKTWAAWTWRSSLATRSGKARARDHVDPQDRIAWRGAQVEACEVGESARSCRR